MTSSDDYESLPESMHPAIHMAAGALAGIGEHCVMYPVDVVKTRMQCINPDPHAKYRGIIHAIREMMANEGVFRPVRGMHIVALAAGPAHALYFSCYERMKILFSGTSQAGHNPIANGLAGCFATLFHDALMVPADAIKQRLQVYASPYSGAIDCLRKIRQREGLSVLYRSYTTQLTMNIPFHSVHLITYELLQDRLNYARTYDPLSHVISGAGAGAIAAAITTPLDVCKTLLNTQECCLAPTGAPTCSLPRNPTITTTTGATNTVLATEEARGLITAVRVIYIQGGLTAFFKGLTPRVLYQMPSTAVAWSCYEFFKHSFAGKPTIL
jgi:solute carrier family 25 iron transporter 28/37